MVIPPFKGNVRIWVTKLTDRRAFLKYKFRKKLSNFLAKKRCIRKKHTTFFAYHSPESCTFQLFKGEPLTAHWLTVQQVTAPSGKNQLGLGFSWESNHKHVQFHWSYPLNILFFQKDSITTILFMSYILYDFFPAVYLANLQSCPTYFPEKKHKTLSAPNGTEHVHGPTT